MLFLNSLFFDDLALLQQNHIVPNHELIDEKDGYVVRFHLSGVEADNIDIQATSKNIKLNAKREASQNIISSNVPTGEFTIRLALPSEIIANEIEANFDNGVLELYCPKHTQTQSFNVNVNIKTPRKLKNREQKKLKPAK